MTTRRTVVRTVLHQRHTTRIAATRRAIAWSDSALQFLGLHP